MLSIRLPEEIDASLKRLAEEAGQTKSDYALEAIVEKIEETEDVQLAEPPRRQKGQTSFSWKSPP
ncbi:MAG: DUF6290 family protein, partial [Candidatus Aminicenantes bacterium]|nr:DUF6290 family protein [Candidatus Aminicenantes bacterium]